MSSTNNLTAKEIEVVREVSKGFSNKEIALKQNRSVDTVKHHVSTAMHKLGVNNRVALSVKATLTNIVSITTEEIKHLMVLIGLAITFIAAMNSIGMDENIARYARSSRPSAQRVIRIRSRREQDQLLKEAC